MSQTSDPDSNINARNETQQTTSPRSAKEGDLRSKQEELAAATAARDAVRGEYDALRKARLDGFMAGEGARGWWGGVGGAGLGVGRSRGRTRGVGGVCGVCKALVLGGSGGAGCVLGGVGRWSVGMVGGGGLAVVQRGDQP
jgi:hypothetical protein